MLFEGIAIFVSTVYLPGFALNRLLGSNCRKLHEILFLQLLSGFLTCGLMMCLLYALEVFSLPLLISIQLSIAIVILLTTHKKYALPWQRFVRYFRQTKNIKTVALFLPLFIATSWLYQKPSEWVLSYGMDAANYMVQAAYYGENDSIFLHDAQQDKYGKFFARPKFKINSTTSRPLIAPMTREFNFPPLWKMMMTLFYHIGGIRLSLYTSLIFGLLTILGFYTLVEQVTGRVYYAMLAAGTLLFSPIFFYYLRLPMSEVLMLYLIVASLTAYYKSCNEEEFSIALPILGGISLASLLLVRADGILIYGGAALFVYYQSFALQTDEIPKPIYYYGLSLFVASILAWFFPLYTSYFYVTTNMGPKAALLISIVVIIMPFLYVALAKMRQRYIILATNLRKLDSVLGFRILAAALLLYFFSLIIIGYFVPDAIVISILDGLNDRFGILIRYEMPGSSLHYRSLFINRMVLLVGPFLVFFGILGAMAILYYRVSFYLPLVLIFLINTLLYFHHPHHSIATVWFVRRYIYNVLPLCIIGTILLFYYVEGRFFNRKSRTYVRAAWLGIILIPYAVIFALGGYKNVEYDGALASLEAFSMNFDDKQVVLIDGNLTMSDAYQLGLKYYFGKEAIGIYYRSITDKEFVSFYEYVRGQGKQLALVFADNRVERRVDNLFAGELQSKHIQYDSSKRGKKKRHVLRMKVFDVKGLRALSAN